MTHFNKKPQVCSLILASLLAVQSSAQIPATLPEKIITNMASSNTAMHDVQVNCDMIETDIMIPCDQDAMRKGEDAPPQECPGTLKAIVWDNGERPPYTPNASESWLYVEEPYGGNITLSLGSGTKDPDVVIANDVDAGPNGQPDYVIAVVYTLEVTQPQQWSGTYYQPFGTGTSDVYLSTYDVFLIAGGGVNVIPREGPVMLNFSPAGSGPCRDGNPHIDMWTNANNPINNLPSLREIAICWSEGYSSTAMVTPPLTWVVLTSNPSDLWYTYGDINNISGIPSVKVQRKPNDGYTDIACYTDVTNNDNHVVIAYNQLLTTGTSFLVEDNVPSAGSIASIPLPNGNALITKIEAMSQNDPNDGDIDWEVVATQSGQAYGHAYQGGSIATEHLSGNYSGLDSKAPAVAAGPGPMINNNIGNLRYAAGFRPIDYNDCYAYPDIIARGIDVYGGGSSGDFQVNTNPV
jgi:hypothetical protein